MKVHVRWMVRRDMPEVLAIEEAVRHHWAWTEEDFLRELRERNVIGMVAETMSGSSAEEVLGFMVYELYKNSLLVENFAVNPKYGSVSDESATGMTIAGALLEKLKSKLSSERRNVVNIRVRETELDLQLCLRREGFKCFKLVRQGYEDSGEDALLFRYDVTAVPTGVCDKTGHEMCDSE